MAIVFTIIALSLLLFITAWIRYDLVAIFAVFFLVVFDKISPDRAFIGFSDPAVITVVAVLIISEALTRSGFASFIVSRLGWTKQSITLQMVVLCSIVGVLSGFMNNVGALALMMPVAIRMAYKTDNPASMYLIPIAFSSILGGMFTLIGTPPNLILSSYKKEVTETAFSMFDFTPVGGIVAIAGIAFVSIIGWRLIPRRETVDIDRKDFLKIENYLCELGLQEKSNFIGKSIGLLQEKYPDINIIAYIRDGKKHFNPNKFTKILEEDSLILEATSDSLDKILSDPELKMATKDLSNLKEDEELILCEVVVTLLSSLKGKTLADLGGLKNVTVMAIARHGVRLKKRISKTKFLVGDILLLHGSPNDLDKVIDKHQLLSIGGREFKGPKPAWRMFSALGIFAIFIFFSLMGWLPVHIALSTCAAVLVVFKYIKIKEAYDGVDWGVIVLLGALFPLGEALEKSGGAKFIADWLLSVSTSLSPILSLVIIMTSTLLLSNIINNAAAAVLMAPVVISLSKSSNLDINLLLMAVAVSASSAFLTPIGHQSNTLVYEPGGYKFTDYTRVGLPLSIIVIAIASYALMYFWS